jgi:hypothetical protein
MTGKADPHLIIRERTCKELGRRMLRAHLEKRYEDARALAERIAYRPSFRLVEPPEWLDTPTRRDCSDEAR